MKVAPAVERAGIHLGVWRDGDGLLVWGTAAPIPALSLVVEVAAPGLLVVKHHRGDESGKFVNVAVLEGDQIKVVDEKASSLPDCPPLLTSLLGFDSPASWASGSTRSTCWCSWRCRCARTAAAACCWSCRPAIPDWRESIVRPIPYAVAPPFAELAELTRNDAGKNRTAAAGRTRVNRAVEAIAGLTAVDGATVLTTDYELLAFGAKIARRKGIAAGGAGDRHRADRRRRRADGASDAARRHASPVGGAVRPRSARRGRAGRVAGRPLHGVRVVAVRRHGARAPRRDAAAVRSLRRG